MDGLFTAENLIALLTLTSLEIVLGIDNIIFISILSGKVAPERRDHARIVGLSLAMVMRIALLLSINWIANLTNPLISLWGHELSGRDLILLGGGLFLLFKATFEIHEKFEDASVEHKISQGTASFQSVIVQIMLLDIVFSLDSVITAVGMADRVEIMIVAVIIAVLIMLVASGPLSAFVERTPTIKMLALSFLLLIGMSLVAEGWHFHVPKGYIYFAMGFSLLVEVLNLRIRSATQAAQSERQFGNEEVKTAAAGDQ